MHVAHVNLVFERTADFAALLERYTTLVRLAESQAATGEARVSVLQRFWCDADLSRNDVCYYARTDNDARLTPAPLTRPHALWRLARDLQPDVVHFNALLFPLQLAQVRRALGRRPVIVLQDHHNSPGRPLKQLAQRLCFPAADGFFFTASGLADRWLARGLLDARRPRFEVVEGSSDFVPLSRERARAATGVSGSPAVLWVGRLAAAKDPETAVRGFAQALAEAPDAQLFMIYQDERLLPVVNQIRRRSSELTQRIHLVGQVRHADLPTWFSAADLFLTSSPDEGCNYALVEALACGLFPACSDNPVHRRLTDEGTLATLFPVRSPDACARAIVAGAAIVVAGGADLRARIRRHFESSLSWPAIARCSLAAYRDLLDRRRLPA